MEVDWRQRHVTTDPPDGYTVHHAVVIARGPRERVLLLCQVGTHVAIVTGIDVAVLDLGAIVLVSVRPDQRGETEELAHVLLAGEWVAGRIEWMPKRKPVLVVPTPVSSP